MEVFMSHIPLSTSDSKVKLELANILHVPPFLRNTSEPLLNFEVYLFPRRKQHTWRNGALTLPTAGIAYLFLERYGGSSPQASLSIGNTRIQFKASNKSPRPEILERILRTPFQDPRMTHEQEQRDAELAALRVRISSIQFGYECRDSVFSVEWERPCVDRASLHFDIERREFHIKVMGTGLFTDTRIAAIRVNQVYWVSASVQQSSGQPIIFFSLDQPPAFMLESSFREILSMLTSQPRRERLTSFDDDHECIAPYTSLAIRLECDSRDDLHAFRKLATAAHTRVHEFSYPIERRCVFSKARLEEYDLWVTVLPWTVAFQIESLLRSWFVSVEEVLSLRGLIDRVVEERGIEYTTALLRDFIPQAQALYWYGTAQHDDEAQRVPTESVQNLFKEAQNKFVYKAPVTDDATLLFCHHVSVTPTTIIPEGPFPERSNRVMRKYSQNQDSFLRVSFQDENRLQFRFDRDVDGRSFVDRRFKCILQQGLTICGRHFDFLAYSQSALKEHAVWFVKPFRHVDDDGIAHEVNAASIIASLGNFRDLSFDPQLIRCPARYAARISQAFTTTDASVTVEVEEIMYADDIRDQSEVYAFTDGVGSTSPQLAQEIWRALDQQKRRGRRVRPYPRAYQIRFQGSKGVLSVDYNLQGRAIVLRPSMIKFENPESTTIEIAEAFDKPKSYFLNRPLIMLLEGLGVPYEIFQDLQDKAVDYAMHSTDSLERSARLLEGHGLGASFRLTSSMLALYRLDVEPLIDDAFWTQMMDYAINHVLRELKQHARIPVPGTDSWTLVGVSDRYGYLHEGEIFVCVDSFDGRGPIYLEGPTLISRSPTIHPGDVQIARAIGPPPSGSHFEQEFNTVVFSTQGQRPLPSCLGGGDLDGDQYNVTTKVELLPPRTYPPALYEPAQKKLVDHESTMADVAEFVAEYITSDTLGMIGSRWLMIADQSTEGIFDTDCLELADLHSAAVDYPKSGQPVPVTRIPKLKLRTKPDWSAPETANSDNGAYYESTRAIGRLFRSINLPAVQTVQRDVRRQRRQMEKDTDLDERTTDDDIRNDFRQHEPYEDDQVAYVVENRVSIFIDTRECDDDTVVSIWESYKTYVSRLRGICADHTLSRSRTAMLTEAEVVVGTIVAKCSQPRKRRNLMSRMREQSANLVNSVKHDIMGDDDPEDVPAEVSLRRAWTAFWLSNLEGDSFGARSFGWIALGCIFDAIKDIEDVERARTLSRR